MPIIPTGWADQELTKLRRRFSVAIDRPRFGALPVKSDYLKVHTIIVAVDGSGDAMGIQEGIDLLPSTGGIVWVKEGTYTITSKINLVSNLVLEGTGKGTKIVVSGVSDALKGQGVSNVTLSRLYLYGDRPNAGIGIYFTTTSSNIKVQDCWVENFGTDGIDSSPLVTLMSITNCTVSNNARYGIFVVHEDSLIHGNAIYNNEQHGICLYNADNSIVANNIVYDNDYSNSASYDGIFLQSTDETIVSGNRCRNNDRYEINVSDAASDYCLIHGNICRGSDHVGAINDSGTNTTSADNIV